MRVLVVSDIHGNWEALQAVAAAEDPDAIVCLGDIVDYGPRPIEAIHWVREHANAVVRGNHDNAVAFGTSCKSAPLFRRLSEESRKLTIPMLPAGDREYLSNLPLRYSFQLEELHLELLHAAPADPLYQYLPASDTAGWQQAIEKIEAHFVLVGHTHLPAILALGSKVVVNPGSVGLPRDGDARACYAILDGSRVELKRVPYDVEKTVSALWEWGLPHDVARSLERLYRGMEPARAIQPPPR